MTDSLQCRPCRKTYSAAEMQGRRSCPLCKGPLVSQKQLENYRAITRETLERLKDQSAFTLGGGAILAMVVQAAIDWYENSSDFKVLTWVVFAGSLASLTATGIWWKTGTRAMMLMASLVFQLTAMVYGFSVFVASSPLMERIHSPSVTWGVSLVAYSPLALSLMAWHLYRNYVQVLKA